MDTKTLDQSLVVLSLESEIGGAEKALLTLLHGVQGNPIHLLAPSTGPLLDQAASIGIECWVTSDLEEGAVRRCRNGGAIVFANRLVLAITACRVGSRTGAPGVVYVHDPPRPDDTRAAKLRKWDARYPLGLFLCTTRPVKRALDRVVATSGRYRVIPPSPESCGCRPSNLAGDNTFLALVRIHPSKRVWHLLDAMKLVVRNRGDTRLIIAGGNLFGQAASLQGQLKKRVRMLGLENHVRFEGFIEEERKHTLLRTVTGLVHPAPSETYGLAIAEAMAHGRPVVAAASPGARILVEHGRTGLITESSSNALAGGLSMLLGLPLRDRLRMGEEGKARISNLTTGVSRKAWNAINRSAC